MGETPRSTNYNSENVGNRNVGGTSISEHPTPGAYFLPGDGSIVQGFSLDLRKPMKTPMLQLQNLKVMTPSS